MFGVWHEETCELLLWIWDGTAHLGLVSPFCPDTARRDLLSMDQNDNLGSLVYANLYCRTVTYSQQVHSVCMHICLLVGPLLELEQSCEEVIVKN